MENRKIVLKVGGSLLFDANLQIREEIVKNFAQILKDSKHIAAVIVGGGKLARTYINAARILDANEALCDTFGIGVSRLNALLLITALGDRAFPEPITSVTEAREKSLWNRILVSGGFIPGQSTTSVTFEIGESIGATDILILTNVDGIYDSDPNKNPSAKKFDEISIPKLEQVIYGEGGNQQAAAGEYRIFDAVSMQILKRSSIQVRLANGEKMPELRRLLVEEDFGSKIGTKIIRN
ncbi:MAG: UMP kinase [Promethearchaeota archaeon]